MRLLLTFLLLLDINFQLDVNSEMGISSWGYLSSFIVINKPVCSVVTALAVTKADITVFINFSLRDSSIHCLSKINYIYVFI